MQTKVINPYRKAGDISKTALDFIAANLPPNPTFDQLSEILVGSVFTPDPENPNMGDGINLFLGAALPFAYNGYVNNGVGSYVKFTDKQLVIIDKLLHGISTTTPENLVDFITGVEETIAASNLPCEEQGVLYLATACAKANSEYWWYQVENYSSSAWVSYLNADKAINYLHVSGWVAASVQGVLLTYGIIKPPQIQLLDIFSSVVGSIGLASGKVVFGWAAVCPPLGELVPNSFREGVTK